MINRQTENEEAKKRVRDRESAWITLRKKKHPEPPLSHILAYPMVANMAGSGVQERVRVSAVRVRGKRRACAIAGGLPCRRTRRSSMSEYRPGVTSPHTLSQRALPLPPLSFHPDPYPISPRSSLDLPLLALLSPRSTLLPPRNVPPTRRSFATLTPSSPPACPLDFSLCRARNFFLHVILFSHYLDPSCLRCSSGPLCPSILASFLSSSTPGRRRFLTPRGYSRFPREAFPSGIS